MKKNEKVIDVNGMKYGDRELSQLIRRKMTTQTMPDRTKYSRKQKHKKKWEN